MLIFSKSICAEMQLGIFSDTTSRYTITVSTILYQLCLEQIKFPMFLAVLFVILRRRVASLLIALI